MKKLQIALTNISYMYVRFAKDEFSVCPPDNLNIT